MVRLVYNPDALGLAVSRGNGVIKAEEIAALDKASSVVDVAKRTAKQIRQDARAEYEREKERGYREGRELADREAIARLLSEQVWLEQKLCSLEKGLADVVKIAVRRVLDSFEDSALAEATIIVAMRRMREQGRLQIRLPTCLMESFVPLVAKLEALFPQISSIEMVADPVLQAPDFVMESATGRIECRMGDTLTGLDALIDATTAALARDNADEAVVAEVNS